MSSVDAKPGLNMMMLDMLKDVKRKTQLNMDV